MATKTIKMDYTKTTKHTYVYSDNNPTPLIPTVYIRRNGLPEKPPQEIRVTIEFDE